jgi:hypothetical protein
MSAPRPAAEPLDVSAVSIAAGFGVIATLCALAIVACACAHGVL